MSLTASFFLLAAVLLSVASMARSGTLDRSGAVGIRTRATRASDEAWRAGHRAAHGAVRAAGLFCLAFGVLTTALALTVPDSAAVAVVLSTAGTGYVALVVALAVASRRANTAAKRATAAADR